MRRTRPMALREKEKSLEIGFCADIPLSFSCLEEARNSFEYHWNGCIHFLEDVKEQCPARLTERAESRRQDFELILQKWSFALETFLRLSEGRLDTKGLQAAQVLRIRYIIGLMNLNSEDLTMNENEMIWDKHCSAHKEILFLAKSIINLGSNRNYSVSSGKSEFTLDTGIVGPLGAVAYKCRDPIIRREAIDLLASAPRQEAGWNSIISAYVCKKILEIEEGGLASVTCCEDVPAWSRVSNVNLDFDLQHRKVRMRYQRQGSPIHPVQEPHEDVIEF